MVKRIYVMFLICCLIVSSTAAAFAANGMADEELSRARKLSKSVNAFAFDLYKEIAKEEKGNIFFSPLSISMALALAYEGAAGETREEMRRVLHYEGNIGEQFRAYLELLSKRPKESGEFLSATAVWPDINSAIRRGYLELVKNYYHSEVKALDFSKPRQASQTVNNWVKSKTKGKIRAFISDDRDIEDICLMLSNALYFKGEWDEKFNKRETKMLTFFHAEKKSSETLFMFRSGNNIDYFENEKLQSIRLNFKNGLYSYIVLLPQRQNSWTDTELSQGLLDEVLTGMKPRSNMTIYLPKFKTESSFELNMILEGMGIKKAFIKGEADFYNIFLPKGIFGKDTVSYYISKVMHKVAFEINENHTEAAAATVVTMRTSKILNRPVEFKADRPYIYIIADNRSGAILLMGRYC
ncbi:MAG: serpin family protein [Synergistaceae bacterium]|nr:serpin family protein [Synergistaceae bacterium]